MNSGDSVQFMSVGTFTPEVPLMTCPVYYCQKTLTSKLSQGNDKREVPDDAVTKSTTYTPGWKVPWTLSLSPYPDPVQVHDILNVKNDSKSIQKTYLGGF